jgi:hypothetical protein
LDEPERDTADGFLLIVESGSDRGLGLGRPDELQGGNGLHASALVAGFEMVHDARHGSHLEGLELFSDFVVLFLNADLGKELVHELVGLPGTEPAIDLINGDLSKVAVGSLEGDLLLGLIAGLDDRAVGEAGEALRGGGTGLVGQEAKEDDA